MLFKLAFRNLLRHFNRSMTLLLTVALGAGALFLFDGFNFGIMNQYKESTIHAKTGHGQLNIKGYRDTIYQKPWKHWITDADSTIAAIKQMPQVSHVFPRTDFYGVLTNGELNVAAKGTGVDGHEEADFFWTINIVEGKMLRDQPNGVIIGVGMARALQAKEGTDLTLLTQTINGRANAMDLTVVGVFHSGIKEMDDSYFRIQRQAAAELIDTDRVESLAIGLKNDDDWNSFASTIQKSNPELEATSFAVLDKIYYQHAVDWLNQQFAVIQLIIIFIVTLGIANSFAFSVIDRTAEIGNLRANGDSAWDITKLLLWEGFLIGLFGAAVGVIIAWVFNTLVIPNGILMPPAPGLTRQYHVRIELRPWMAVITLVMGVITALVATLFVSFKRVRMPIGEALRSRV